MDIIKKLERFKIRAGERHNHKYDYSLVSYKTPDDFVEIGCPQHGIFSQRVRNHLNGRGCHQCANAARNDAKRVTTDDIISRFKQIHGNRYDYSKTQHIHWDVPVIIICSIHGEFSQNINNHLAGQNCPKCFERITNTGDFIIKARRKHGDLYDYSKVVWTSSKHKVTITCPTHGDFTQSPNAHYRGAGCPDCFGTPKLTTQQWIEKATEVHKEKYDYSRSIYLGADKHITIVCPVHGEFTQSAASHTNQECGCPSCSHSISQGELKIQEFIQQFDSVICRNRTIITPYELDIVIPAKKVAIEYCGLRWHSEIAGRKDRRYHLNKLKATNAAGYRLVTIFEDEWINHSEIVKAKLKHIIGHTTAPIYARKCSIQKLNSKTANAFLKLHHLQGTGRAAYWYGLFYDNLLVAVMTFSKPSIAKGGKNQEGFELVRYASSRHIIGGAGKLLKAFINDHSPSRIITYADLRWSEGNLYKQLGFTLSHQSPPNYWYYQQQKRIHRFALRKNTSDNPNLTEWENRQLQGWDRIWDCGNLVYLWTPQG